MEYLRKLFHCCSAKASPTMECEEIVEDTENLPTVDVIDINDREEGPRRNKVALLPGFSLMDWIKLGNSGQDLTGVGGAFKDVSEEELKNHKTQDDAWICLRGKVYNVTAYMGFHPGGIPELMRGVGKDATKLFTEIHPWVNYESILQKCLVGRLVNHLPPAHPSVPHNDEAAAEAESRVEPKLPRQLPPIESGCVDESIFESDIQMNWCQTVTTVKFMFYCRASSPQIVIKLNSDKHLRVLIRVKKRLHVFGFKLEKKINWPCDVSMNTDTGRFNLELEKKEPEFWGRYGEDHADNAMIAASVDEIEAYHPAEIVDIHQVTPNVRIFVFKFMEKVVMWVPIGHDIRIRGIIEGIDYAKQYTPIPPHLPHGTHTLQHWHQNYICCMVKYYEGGALTPYLFSKKQHEFVEIGGISGSFNIRMLRHVSELYMIAAGSGLSPMLRLIVWAIAKKQQVKAMNLLYINRYEQDIIWRKELNELMKKEKWFKVTYCLSQPPEDWKGLSGRLDENMLDEFLPVVDVIPDQLPEFYICVCGPIQFCEMVQNYLLERGYDDCSHCFIG